MTFEFKNIFKKSLIPIFLIAVLAGYLSGLYVGKSQCKICQPEDVDFSLFWEAYNKLKESFVTPEKLDVQKIIYGAISGMLKSLDDPYTTFFNPEETKQFLEEIKGKFEGVGMEVGIKQGQLIIIAPLENTPAQRAGLRAGDKILKIDGKDTIDLTVEEAVDLIRGPKSTEVTLTILRDEWTEPKDIKLVREVIIIPSLKWELKEGDIAYIRIYQFSEGVNSDFAKAALEILSSPAKKIILDLRDNPGGLLDEAVTISGWFLKRGDVVVIEDFGDGKEKNNYESEGPGRLSEYPVVILINYGSASASEILAGAIKDNKGVQLIGEKSFGKGLVQESIRLSDGSSLKITVAKWLTPKGISINDVGLEPDIMVVMTEKDRQEGKDPQLDKAIEIMKEIQ